MHGHDHAAGFKQRRHAVRDIIQETVDITVVECVLNNKPIPAADCNAGITNGTFVLVAGDSASIPTFTATSRSSVYTSSISALQAALTSIALPTQSFYATPASGASGNATVTSQAVKSTSLLSVPGIANSFTTTHGSSLSASQTSSASAGPTPISTNPSAIGRKFPDGVLNCNQFPSSYGAVALDWLGIGGWASAQLPGDTTAQGFDNILEVTQGQSKNGNGCLENSFCAYACPDGYMKSQWPAVQGATGQSIGGLLCKGGKLYKTNQNSPTLCIDSPKEVQIFVTNNLSENVAVCQTNYPGDEKMSLPTDSQPGTTLPLACPNGATYYTWEEKPTSAQYYINMPGYSIDKACVWGSEGDDFGNWAPMNAGVGYSNGIAWLSIFPNLPTQPNSRLPFTVEIIGDYVSETCRYRNGQYCSGANYETCSANGCTVSSSTGNVYFVFSN